MALQARVADWRFIGRGRRLVLHRFRDFRDGEGAPEASATASDSAAWGIFSSACPERRNRCAAAR